MPFHPRRRRRRRNRMVRFRPVVIDPEQKFFGVNIGGTVTLPITRVLPMTFILQGVGVSSRIGTQVKVISAFLRMSVSRGLGQGPGEGAILRWGFVWDTQTSPTFTPLSAIDLFENVGVSDVDAPYSLDHPGRFIWLADSTLSLSEGTTARFVKHYAEINRVARYPTPFFPLAFSGVLYLVLASNIPLAVNAPDVAAHVRIRFVG